MNTGALTPPEMGKAKTDALRKGIPLRESIIRARFPGLIVIVPE